MGGVDRGATGGARAPYKFGGGDAGQSHVLDRSRFGVFGDPEKGSRTLLRELLASAGKLPPVQGCLIWEALPQVTKRPLPQAGPAPKREQSWRQHNEAWTPR